MFLLPVPENFPSGCLQKAALHSLKPVPETAVQTHWHPLNNITRKFEVKTPDVVVKVNPERTDLVETMEIEGKQYLVIQIDEHLEVNGISVNPETGEVQYNE